MAFLKDEYDLLNSQHRTVLGDSSIETSEALKPLWASFNTFFGAISNVATQFRRMEKDSAENLDLSNQLGAANQTISNLTARIDSLERRTNAKAANDDIGLPIQRAALVSFLPKLVQKNPSLEACLTAVQVIFADRITVLDSAYDSAAAAHFFRYGEQAFDLLWKLATEYWELIRSDGDTEARKVFGSSYAPRESTKLSKDGQGRRTFQYQEKPVLMEKHLKIGVADTPAETLRVHFEWFANEDRIVIGHCGKHLAF